MVEKIDYSDENHERIRILTNQFTEFIKEYKTFIDNEYTCNTNKAHQITYQLTGKLNYRGRYIPQNSFPTSDLNKIFHGDFEAAKENIAEVQWVHDICKYNM
jgi:hypothetical protein